MNGKKEAALFSDGSGSLKNSIYAVYGREIVDKMIDRVVVHENDGLITVELIMNYSDAKEEYSGILREILSEVENG